MIRSLNILLIVFAFAAPLTAWSEPIRIGGTTSVRDSGLLDALQTAFSEDTGRDMQFIVGGTGRVLKLLEAQDVSGALVHDTRSELALVDGGGAARRRDVMRNDYIILGPREVNVPAEAVPLLQELAATRLAFVSRGDNSGTHKAELRLWQAAQIDVATKAARRWYRKSGTGQGATLNIAASLDAFVLADGATWLAFENKADLRPKGCFGDALKNVYGVLVGYDDQAVDADGALFAQWLTGPGQAVIAAFKIGDMAPFASLSDMQREGPMPTAEAFCSG
ncbi:substrate-binding domain-containing protein [Alphaproteobacteria bacterium]|nr:substrate-binding domain-containing protein [Alphaproteobacteria bacterium]